MSFRRRPPSGRLNLPLVGVIVLLAAIGIALAIYWRQQKPVGPVPGLAAVGLSIEELTAAVALGHAAIGYLEMERFAEADEILVDLQKKLPHEPLVARNLAIGRVLLLENPNSDPEIEKVQQALSALAQVEPGSATTNWLAGRAFLKLAERNFGTDVGQQYRDSGLKQLHEATQRDPNNVAFWYQLYDGSKNLREPQMVTEARQALDQAYRLAPDNLNVALDWMTVHAAGKDPELAKSLPSIRSLIEPIAPGVKRRVSGDQGDVLKRIDQLKTAVENQQWDVAPRMANMIQNLLKSEETTRSDLRRVLQNPLSYILHDFSSTVRNVLAEAESATPLGIAVKYSAAWGANEPNGIVEAQLVDFDLDGSVELAVLTAGTLEVRRLEGDSQLGSTLTSREIPAGMQQLLIADLDRDTVVTRGASKAAERFPDHRFPFYQADVDIIVLGAGGIQVLKNELADDGQTRTLEPVPQDAPFEALRNVIAGTLVDVDHDGDVDVICSVEGRVQVWWNRDNLTFEDGTKWSQLPPPELRIECFSIADWDRDADVDILVGGAGMARSGILENMRHGQVRWRPFDADFADAGSAAKLHVWEADGNASWDLLAAGPQGLKTVLTTTVPAQSVTKLRSAVVAPGLFRAAMILDYDNDASLDVLASGDGGATLWHGHPDGSLTSAPEVLPAGLKFDRADAVDVDEDGDLDLLALQAGKLSLWRNEGGSKNHWLSIRVRGEKEDRSGRVNHLGIGSLLEIRTGLQYQAQVVQRPVTHFGLGAAANADVMRILFTNGIPQSVVQPKADQLVSEIMVDKTSCPFLYGWNGERFEFVTDLLWNAPLGLQLADGVLAPDRPWEFLKIRGDQLMLRGEYYELQVTEEFWEAGYFDQVELIAVDHPSDVEIYSNEKVGPAEISERYIHTVRNRRLPVAARNQHGRDLLPALSQADGEMAIPFDRTIRKGLAEEHYLELDLGPLGAPRRILLFLTGWFQPGDSSLSVAASHNPTLSPSQPPSIWVPDEHGEWKQTVPFMGFPGGKPKTIAIDLSRAFLTQDYRLRIATNLQLYWDQVFFTVDEEPGEVRETNLPLISADLHYRGFSATTPFLGPRPQAFDYSICSQDPQWPPMRGRFTRFGQVKELLTDIDRRMAVLASGDEMTLRFGGLPAPPAGWTRDFLMHNVGWVKDADLNTVWGQTVEPLPFIGMPSYPYVLPETAEDSDKEFARYLREYQTRESIPSRFWRDVSE